MAKATPRLAACLCLGLASIGAEAQAPAPKADAQAAAPAAKPGAAAAVPKLRPFEVLVNRTKMGEWTMLEADGGLHATADMLAEWRLVEPQGVTPLVFRGQPWLPLFALPGYRAQIDFSTQTLELEFAAAAFKGTQLASAAQERSPLSPKVPALFLNYDLSSTLSVSQGHAVAADHGALAEIGLAWGPGTLVSSHVGRSLASNDPLQPQSWRRLETTWTRDFPSDNLTLRIGDSATRPSMWGRAVYFGGVQLARNFGLTPGFITQPIPALSGTASGPSTVELYINNSLRQTAVVPAGPFTVENFSQLTGAGEARIVVRDLLGRETVIVRPFFSNARLLEAGLTDWAVDAGRVRRGLGNENADYGERFATGLARHGLSQALTLEGRGEWSPALQNAGLGVTAALPFQALGQAALALSRADGVGRGFKALAGVDWQALRTGAGARLGAASQGYRELGFGIDELPYKFEASASVRHSIDETAAVGFSIARLSTYTQGSTTSFAASYSMRVGERGTLVFNGSRVMGNASGSSFGAALTLPLESGRVVTSSVSSSGGRVDAYASTGSVSASETGLSWRALTGYRAGGAFAEGGAFYQGGRGAITVDATASRQAQVARVSGQGGLVFVDGGLYTARRLQESFALVEVKGYGDVGVGFQGESLTRTNAQGLALLTRLAPYQPNAVRLDPNDLPFSAELDTIEQTVVPGWRSGVKVVFPVRSGRAALLRLVLDDGEPAPAGALIVIEGDTKEFFVARRGEAFVTGLPDRATVRLNWKGARCDLTLALPPGKPDEVPRIGPITCKGVAR